MRYLTVDELLGAFPRLRRSSCFHCRRALTLLEARQILEGDLDCPGCGGSSVLSTEAPGPTAGVAIAFGLQPEPSRRTAAPFVAIVGEPNASGPPPGSAIAFGLTGRLEPGRVFVGVDPARGPARSVIVGVRAWADAPIRILHHFELDDRPPVFRVTSEGDA